MSHLMIPIKGRFQISKCPLGSRLVYKSSKRNDSNVLSSVKSLLQKTSTLQVLHNPIVIRLLTALKIPRGTILHLRHQNSTEATLTRMKEYLKPRKIQVQSSHKRRLKLQSISKAHPQLRVSSSNQSIQISRKKSIIERWAVASSWTI